MISSDKKKIALMIFGAIFFFVLDRVLKYWALNILQYREIDIIENYFKLSLAKNEFIAFSLPLSGIPLMIINVIIICIIFVYIYNLLKKNEQIEAGFLSIILFGAISNMYDRVQLGYVIDYLDLKWFTVFNVADSMIVVSSFALIIYLMRHKKV